MGEQAHTVCLLLSKARVTPTSPTVSTSRTKLTSRIEVVTFKQNTYDLSKLTVDLDFLNFGDCEEKLIGEIIYIS